MSSAEISEIENAGRTTHFAPDTARDRHFAYSLFIASVGWMIGFVVVASILLFAFT